MSEPIHRTVIEVEVFSRGPYRQRLEGAFDWLAAVNYDITDGECIGDVRIVSDEVVPPDRVKDEMVRIGNDGTFFEDEDS